MMIRQLSPEERERNEVRIEELMIFKRYPCPSIRRMNSEKELVFKTIFDTLPFSKIPERIHECIIRYIEYGIIPGSFLQAIICNNLRETYAQCDNENERHIKDYVKWFYIYAPSPCWGTKEKMDLWVRGIMLRKGYPNG